MGGAHGEGTVTAPIDLGALASGKLQHQEGRFGHRTHPPDEILEDAAAARIALGPNFLEHLLGGVAVALQHPHDLAFERVEFASPFGTPALLISWASHPLGHRLGVQMQFGGDLGHGQVFLVGQCA